MTFSKARTSAAAGSPPALGEPARDRGVVAGGVGERLGREALARPQRQPAVGVAQLLEHRVVALGRDHDRA